MTIEDISKAKKLFEELEYIENLIKSLHENAEKALTQNAKIVLSIKMEFHDSVKENVLDEDGSLSGDSYKGYAIRFFNPFGCGSNEAPERFHTEINISEKYAMEIFTQVMNNAMLERGKIIKKIEGLKSK